MQYQRESYKDSGGILLTTNHSKMDQIEKYIQLFLLTITGLILVSALATLGLIFGGVI